MCPAARALHRLGGMSHIAMLIDEMFEDSEFRVPYDRLRAAGNEVDLIGRKAGAEVTGKAERERVKIDKAAEDVDPDDYDAVVIPGGYSPDHLRTHAPAVDFLREIAAANKPVAAVCHGPSMLIEADLVDGRHVTSWPSIKTDLVKAGAHWTDQEVVLDGNLITSRKPADLEAFSDAILHELADGVPQRAEPPHTVEHRPGA